MSGVTTVRTFNDTGLPFEMCEQLPVLFTVKNLWRKRDVVVHRHPTLQGKLITCGYWFDGSTRNACVEDEQDYARELEELPWRQHFTFE